MCVLNIVPVFCLALLQPGCLQLVHSLYMAGSVQMLKFHFFASQWTHASTSYPVLSWKMAVERVS